MEVYTAFVSCPRSQQRALQKAIHEQYNIDIKESVQSVLRHEALGNNIRITYFDCCPKGCIAYTGSYQESQECRYCGQPRYHEDKKQLHGLLQPVAQFPYIPLVDRLINQFSSQQRARDLQRQKGAAFSSHKERVYTDICDGDLFHHWHDIGLFHNPRHLVLRLTVDGIGLTATARKYTIVILVVLNICNLESTIREKLENVLVSIIIPGSV